MTDHGHKVAAGQYGRRWKAYVNGEPLVDRAGYARLFHTEEGALEAADMDAWLRDQRQAAQPDASQPGMEREARNAPILPPPSGEGG